MHSLNDIIASVLNTNALSLKDVIAVSEVSKDLHRIVKEQEFYFWKQTFEEIINRGKTYISNAKDEDYLEENDEVLRSTNNQSTTANIPVLHKLDTARNGFLPCFSTNIHPSIVKQHGYYHMTKCLLSKTCHKCGKMGNFAHPIAFRRYCSQQCADNDEDLISTCLALQGKESIPIIINDLSFSSKKVYVDGLKGASKSNASINDHDDSPSMPSLVDTTLNETSHTYEISESSQHTVFTNKEVTLPAVSQSPSNPLTSTSIYQHCYPVGVLKTGNENSLCNLVGFTHAFSCSSEGCNVSGDLISILMHRRLQHDIIYTNQNNWDFEVVYPEAQTQKSLKSSLNNKFLKYQETLSQVVSDGITYYAMGVSTKKANGNFIICYNWMMNFCNGCSLAIDLRSIVDSIDENREVYDLDVCFQSHDNSVPVHLMFMEADNETEGTSGKDLINKNGLSSLIECLSLDSELEVIELLAFLISVALSPYTLETFSRKSFQEEDEQGILKTLISRLHCYSSSTNNVTPGGMGPQKRCSIMNSISEICLNSFFKVQKELSMYNVRRLVRRRGTYY